MPNQYLNRRTGAPTETDSLLLRRHSLSFWEQ
jgi:hypothetical protein